MTPVEVRRGGSPVILGLPHTGIWLPDDVRADLNERGRSLADTDWHVDRLYDGLLAEATTVRALFHRYVIDPNRDPSGASLYPGQNTTGLTPMTDFDGAPIWTREPSLEAIEARRIAYHAPYHGALVAEIARVRARHGVAILFDCHSIRSVIPHLFEGVLPDFNIGTNNGATCAPRLERAVLAVCEAADGYSCVLNGRFKGGWTTRRYGRPEEGVHAIQMELAQQAYLVDERAGWAYDEAKAARLRPHLKAVLQTLTECAAHLQEVTHDRSAP